LAKVSTAFYSIISQEELVHGRKDIFSDCLFINLYILSSSLLLLSITSLYQLKIEILKDVGYKREVAHIWGALWTQEEIGIHPTV
jgi:hypothetical protein